jgi:serine/threonine-protein kinase
MVHPYSMELGHQHDHSVPPLDEACDQFEAEWRKGSRPRAEDFLDKRRESERAKLLRWLLQVEVELRYNDGEAPTPDEYLRRFPGHPDVITDVFAASLAGAAPVETIRMPAADVWPGDGDDPDRVPRGNGRVAAGSRFRVLGAHAQGGLGKIYLAWDEELGREVAVKEIHRDRADGESRERFLREAKITGNLEHPGIVPVYALGSFGDGRPFYAMRFIRGDSLKRAIAQFHAADVPGREPGERVIALRSLLRRFIDVCNAMSCCARRGRATSCRREWSSARCRERSRPCV